MMLKALFVYIMWNITKTLLQRKAPGSNDAMTGAQLDPSLVDKQKATLCARNPHKEEYTEIALTFEATRGSHLQQNINWNSSSTRGYRKIVLSTNFDKQQGSLRGRGAGLVTSSFPTDWKEPATS